MAYTTINKSTAHFNTKLYNGNGSTQNITGVGFQPDWVWIKQRNGVASHHVYDVVRGVQKFLHIDGTTVEATQTNAVSSFDSDGFTVGSNTNLNGAGGTGGTYVAWNWKAGGSAVANNDGSITSYVSVNTTAGFSIVKWSASASATIGHGLGVKPAMVITKSRDNATNWATWHKGLTGTEEDVGLTLNTNSASASFYTDYWGTGGFTSSVFGVLNSGFHNNAGEMISYCFRDVTGYSKFGTYKGNGNVDGTFVYTGFKPAFIMQKKSSGTSDWVIYDNKRSIFNVVTKELKPNSSAAESTFDGIDILSNGFKQRSDYSYTNNSGATYIYMAFGQSLVGSNNVPCTAR